MWFNLRTQCVNDRTMYFRNIFDMEKKRNRSKMQKEKTGVSPTTHCFYLLAGLL